jgi:DNA-binding transcriptional MerR regulator
MRIGQVAERAGVSTRAIRHYERIGVLPAPERTEAGHRAYTEDVLARLGFIRAARAAGLSLAEIRELIRTREAGRSPCTQAIELAEARARHLSERIAELERIRTRLLTVAERGRALDPAECRRSSVCHVLQGPPG